MKTASPLNAEALAWLQEFARCVRDRTYSAARSLFHEEVYSFGTVADQARGLDSLVSRQWREVWDVTQEFDFDYPSARSWEQDGLVVVAAPWSSVGSGEDGNRFKRQGRATLVLSRRDADWKAVHTHFSMNPDV